MKELKPCPFCGRRPRYARGTTALGKTEWQVWCPYRTCFIQPMTEWREDKEQARCDWEVRKC